jgi:prepilin-type processing-associated H-X9-DG protein
LIELLTVIAIIGILAAILIPTIGQIRRMASSAKCAAQMREIGRAIHLYTEDNRERLPTSPVHNSLHTGQGPWFNREERRLQYFLGRYLNSPRGTTWSTTPAQMDFDPNFAWPAFLSAAQTGAPSVVLNTSVRLRGGTTGSPWVGRASGSTYIGRSFSEIEERSTQRVLIEVDNKSSPGAWSGTLPPEPVHGSTRNALFFDWHVGKVPVNP